MRAVRGGIFRRSRSKVIAPQRQAEGAIRRRAVLQAHLLQLARQHPAAAGRQHLPPEVFFDDGLDARDLAGHRVGPDQAAGRLGVTSNELGDGDEQDLSLRSEVWRSPSNRSGSKGRMAGRARRSSSYLLRLVPSLLSFEPWLARAARSSALRRSESATSCSLCGAPSRRMPCWKKPRCGAARPDSWARRALSSRCLPGAARKGERSSHKFR